MRLSVVFELLLVLLFLAFAAARVIDPKNTTKNVTKVIKKTTTVRQGPPNRYCACTSRMCNCCRDFSLPVVPIKGPGCASIMYLQKDTMMVTMQFGDRVLSNTTITGKNPRPICMALPGGISQFCGRIYGISRKGDQFRACLGLELRALDDIEAALRVSCFKFGPKGVNLESAPPVPAESSTGNKEPDTDDDDDYDIEDDDDDDDLIGLVDDEDEGASNEDNEVDSDSDSVDYTGFSVLGEDILGTFFSDDSSSKKKKVNKKTSKPQTPILKASTTTRRPILPIRRRSTAKPETVTKRPINRITRPKPVKQRPSSVKPQNVAKPSPSEATAVFPQITVQQVNIATSTPPTTTVNYVKDIVSKEPTMQTSLPAINIMESHEKEQSTQSVEISMAPTEAPITFTMTTSSLETSSTKNNVKSEIKIPQTDLAKVEAVAAIAQQDVTSGVISSSALSSEKTQKPVDGVTLKYEKISSYMTEHTTPYIPETTEKTNSVKYVPISVDTSRPNQVEITHTHNSLDKLISNELGANSHTHGIKHKVTTIYQSTTEINSEEEGSNENSDEDENEDDDENDEVDQEEKEEGGEEEEEEEEDDDDDDNDDDKESSENQKVEQNLIRKKYNYTINLQKQPVKNQNNKPTEVDEDDLLSEVLSDEDEEAEDDSSNENKPILVSVKKQNNKNKIKNNEKENDDDKKDISSDSQENHKKVKPTKVSVNKKPIPEKNDNEDDDDDDDILEVLEEDDDDDDEDSDDDDDDDDDEDDEKNKKKKVTENYQAVTQSTAQINPTKVKKPLIQTTSQNTGSKKPVATGTTTEKYFIYNEPEKMPEKIIIYNKPIEKVTEKVIMYKEPVNRVTEKVVYQQPNNVVTEKVFMYKEPENLINTQAPQKIIFYKEPTATVPEKYVIYKEPMTQQVVQKVTEQIMGKPGVFINNKETHTFEVNKDDDFKPGEKDTENDEEESSEEESDDFEEKPTLMASIIKPGFSNKYAEEHDLADSDDLDIEDSEDEGNDFEEDRKLKQKAKKAVVKFSSSNVKPTINNNNFKIFGLSELTGQRKKYYSQPENNKPISSSRTHRRMNLDRLVNF